jgi:hypothetical protein
VASCLLQRKLVERAKQMTEEDSADRSTQKEALQQEFEQLLNIFFTGALAMQQQQQQQQCLVASSTSSTSTSNRCKVWLVLMAAVAAAAAAASPAAAREPGWQQQ